MDAIENKVARAVKGTTLMEGEGKQGEAVDRGPEKS